MNLNEGDKISSIAKVANEDVGPTGDAPLPSETPPETPISPTDAPA
jgi:hypothetical protein